LTERSTSQSISRSGEIHSAPDPPIIPRKAHLNELEQSPENFATERRDPEDPGGWAALERTGDEHCRDPSGGNALRLQGGMNPRFFDGTAVESEAAAVLAADAAA
jgi:hypothetical protein